MCLSADLSVGLSSIGISEFSDVSLPEEQAAQFAAARANILQMQQQQPSNQTPSHIGGAPNLVQAFHDTHVKQGDSVTFTCVITGTPKPKVC